MSPQKLIFKTESVVFRSGNSNSCYSRQCCKQSSFKTNRVTFHFISYTVAGSCLACVASITVAFFTKKLIFVVLDTREMGREQKQGGERRRRFPFSLSPPLPPPFFCSRPISRVSKKLIRKSAF